MNSYMKMETIIEPINYSVTIIKTYENDKLLETASGFFYRIMKNDSRYLITNKHVVQRSDFNPNYVEIRLHDNDNVTKEFNNIRIKIKENQKALWLEYPDNDIYCDVVAIPLCDGTMTKEYQAIFNNSKINFFTRDNVNTIMPAEFGKLSVIGYPKNFYDKIHNLPIYRQATIASQYTVHFMDEPYFLIDSKLHNGMSGSPVVSAGSGSYMGIGTGGNNLFGIFSEEHEIYDEPLGLNTVWYAHVLLDITNDI